MNGNTITNYIALLSCLIQCVHNIISLTVYSVEYKHCIRYTNMNCKHTIYTPGQRNGHVNLLCISSSVPQLQVDSHRSLPYCVCVVCVCVCVCETPQITVVDETI